jgi:hypothetical protein
MPKLVPLQKDDYDMLRILGKAWLDTQTSTESFEAYIHLENLASELNVDFIVLDDKIIITSK